MGIVLVRCANTDCGLPVYRVPFFRSPFEAARAIPVEFSCPGCGGHATISGVYDARGHLIPPEVVEIR